MNKIEYKTLNETLYSEVLDNGLHVYMLPKQDFQKTYVTFSTNLGSLDEKICTDEGDIHLPSGIAHFLEHKLFEQDGQDVSKRFAMHQADVNAFTQHNRTTYLFSCTDHLYENITTLIDFVQHPKFTEEGIERERGIITQEMKMYEDDPNSVAYYGVLNNMFTEHPLRNNILGTKESLQQIDKKTLELTHKYFYNPSNMILFITGNIIPEEVLAHVKTLQFKKEKEFERKDITVEPTTIVKKEEAIERDIIVPNFLLGIKQTGITDPKKIMKEEITLSILTDLVFGKSSKNHKEMIQKGLINESFGIDISLEQSFGLILLGGDTYYPSKLKEHLLNITLNLNEFEVTEGDFNRTKKQIIGGFIKSLNSIEFIANTFTKYHYFGASMFHILDVASEITIEDVNRVKAHFMNAEAYSDYTIYPKKDDA